MKRMLTLLAATAVLTLPALAPAQAETPAAHPTSSAAADTRAALRDLWIGHIFWVRNVVDARLAGDASRAKASEQQVVANAHAIAGAIEPFYGKPASEQLFGLLAGHWGAISDYLDATRAGDHAAEERASGALAVNADRIATFLSGANPHLPADALRGMLRAHGAHHVQQIQQLHAKQFEAEARTWAAMKDHIYAISDALAAALAEQFPEKFR